jgi:hypothetical protein
MSQDLCRDDIPFTFQEWRVEVTIGKRALWIREPDRVDLQEEPLIPIGITVKTNMPPGYSSSTQEAWDL